MSHGEAKGGWYHWVLAENESEVDVHQVTVLLHHDVVIVSVADPEHVRCNAVARRRAQEILTGVLETNSNRLAFGFKPTHHFGCNDDMVQTHATQKSSMQRDKCTVLWRPMLRSIFTKAPSS